MNKLTTSACWGGVVGAGLAEGRLAGGRPGPVEERGRPDNR